MNDITNTYNVVAKGAVTGDEKAVAMEDVENIPPPKHLHDPKDLLSREQLAFLDALDDLYEKRDDLMERAREQVEEQDKGNVSLTCGDLYHGMRSIQTELSEVKTAIAGGIVKWRVLELRSYKDRIVQRNLVLRQTELLRKVVKKWSGYAKLEARERKQPFRNGAVTLWMMFDRRAVFSGMSRWKMQTYKKTGRWGAHAREYDLESELSYGPEESVDEFADEGEAEYAYLQALTIGTKMSMSLRGLYSNVQVDQLYGKVTQEKIPIYTWPMVVKHELEADAQLVQAAHLHADADVVGLVGDVASALRVKQAMNGVGNLATKTSQRVREVITQ
eukprot:GFYU01015705.1.p1 GENE.GFYU01015705.1~~GFYU01015705.1.p1  ORF type:complete len:356 (-),score=132.88 GFYU01015705.1:124-1119(-)